MLVVVALNTIHQKKSHSGQPAPCLVSATKRGAVDFNFNLGRSLSLGMGLAWSANVLIQTSHKQLNTSPGDWVGNLAALHLKRARHRECPAHKNMNSYTVLLENRSASLKAIKSLWSLRFFSLSSPVENGNSSCSASDYSRS